VKRFSEKIMLNASVPDPKFARLLSRHFCELPNRDTRKPARYAVWI
jgi:hypothetical protein